MERIIKIAYCLKTGDYILWHGGSIIERYLSCYDTLDDPIFYVEWDDLLHDRSAMEFVRQQMSALQQAELDKVDAHWRGQPELFNAAFAAKHSVRDLQNEMGDFVEDEQGVWPNIPRSHWWWWPITDDGA